MKRILYYLLSDGDSVAYSIGVLLETVLSHKKKVGILCESEDTMNKLDHDLWTFSPFYFIPHETDKVDDTTLHPVLLSCLVDNINNRESILLFGSDDFIFNNIESVKNIDIVQDIMIFSHKLIDLQDVKDCAISVFCRDLNSKKWIQKI